MLPVDTFATEIKMKSNDQPTRCPKINSHKIIDSIPGAILSMIRSIATHDLVRVDLVAIDLMRMIS